MAGSGEADSAGSLGKFLDAWLESIEAEQANIRTRIEWQRRDIAEFRAVLDAMSRMLDGEEEKLDELEGGVRRSP